MPFPDPTDGLVYQNLLMLGFDELQWLQDENNRLVRRARLARLLEPGLILTRDRGGSLEAAWLVDDDDDDGTLTISTGSTPAQPCFVDADGFVVYLEEDGAAVVTLPDDATWYTLVVRRATTTAERGTLEFTTGSAAVVGTGTEFTRFSGYTTSGYNRGTRLFIDSSATGNDGTYEVDTITDDEHMTLREIIPGTNETGVAFAISGNFATPAPATPQLHQRQIPEFEAVTRTRQASGGDLILADVKRDDGGSPKVTIIDRRQGSRLRSIPERPHGIVLQPSIAFDTVTPYTAAALARRTALSTADNWDWTALAPTSTGTLLAAVHNLTTGAIRARVYEPTSAGAGALYWGDPGGAPVDIDAGANGNQPALVQTPDGSGWTHVCVYVDTSTTELKCRKTTDNGATWTSAATIFQPTNADAANLVERPALLLARDGRLYCACGYFDKTLNAGAGQWVIRYIYSDNYGQTWTVNGDSGEALVTLSPAADARRPAMAQGPDGTIYTAYERSAVGVDGGSVYLFTGSVDAPEPLVVSLTGGTSVAGISGKRLGPALWVSEGGHVCVLYTMWTTVDFLAVGCTVMAGSVAVHAMELFRVETAAVAQEQLAVSVAQGRGAVHVLYKDSAAATSNAVHIPLLPVETGFGAGWLP